MFTINLFGKFSITDAQGRPVPINGSKAQGLLAYLALNTEMPPSRDRLMALFWGDRFTEQARQSLRQAIAKLRRSLADGENSALTAENDRVGLDPSRVVVDVDRFTHDAHDPSEDATNRAVALMTGPVLDGLYGQQSEFEDWIASERQRIATLACKVFERAVGFAVRRGATDEALVIARRLVALDPLRDASQMVLIRLLAQSGERAAAIQHFNAYEAMLEAELGVGAGSDLQHLIGEIRGEKFLPEPASDFDGTATETAPTPTSGAAEDTRTTIAVVPFATMAAENDQASLAEGLTQDVTTNLSRFRWLDVRASPDVDGPRLTSAQLATLGKELGLDYVVHGSMRSQGAQVRLTVQLAEPATNRYLWVQRYDRAGDDTFALQDELSDTIAASVEAELERVAGKAARLVEFDETNAWEAYHRGLAIQYEFNADTNAQAQTYFRRAIELDPNFGAAYARLSYAMIIAAIYFEAEDLDQLLDKALDLARTAVRMDPEDAVGRFALGRVYLARGEYDRSLAELEVAISLNPGMAQAHCALGDSLAYSGELEKAMGCFEEAVRVSPTDPYRWAFLGYGASALLFKSDFPGALDWATRAEAVPNSHYWATAIKASALGHMGETDRASEAIRDLKVRRPGITCDFVRDRLFYLRDQAQVDTYVEGLRKAGLD